MKEVIQKYLELIRDGLKADAQSKGQLIPQNWRITANNEQGQLYAAHYFKYLVYGRGPGKQPPPDAMLKSVQQHPEWLERARQTYANITEKQLAFLIGRKIGREGTEIYKGTKKGIDLLGVMETNMPFLLEELAKNQALNIQTSFHKALT